MSTIDPTEARAAEHGNKMIEVRVRFWTDGIAPKGSIFPKHAWDSGVVTMDGNKSHGIVPKSPAPFNSILELQAILAKVLVAHDVTLRPHRKSKKLFKW
jgi:hypothetical protein